MAQPWHSHGTATAQPGILPSCRSFWQNCLLASGLVMRHGTFINLGIPNHARQSPNCCYPICNWENIAVISQLIPIAVSFLVTKGWCLILHNWPCNVFWNRPDHELTKVRSGQAGWLFVGHLADSRPYHVDWALLITVIKHVCILLVWPLNLYGFQSSFFPHVPQVQNMNVCYLKAVKTWSSHKADDPGFFGMWATNQAPKSQVDSWWKYL